MTQRDSIILTCEEALESIRIDFCQYDPQIVLFCEILRLITGDHASVQTETHKKGAWVRLPGHRSLCWMDGTALGQHVCRVLESVDPGPDLMAAICARVFQTRATTEPNPETGSDGIRIETGIEDFSCQQCGHCCRSLNYHDALIPEDVERWEKDGRHDILKWVGRFRNRKGETVYRIWVTPGTIEVTSPCPFLKTRSSENRIICQIHPAKPSICRQYPINRKHAQMTGCPGFGTRRS